MTRALTPRELTAEVIRATLEGLAESFEEESRRRFSGRQIATILRQTAGRLPVGLPGLSEEAKP